jgi:hypothetical protein
VLRIFSLARVLLGARCVMAVLAVSAPSVGARPTPINGAGLIGTYAPRHRRNGSRTSRVPISHRVAQLGHHVFRASGDAARLEQVADAAGELDGVPSLLAVLDDRNGGPRPVKLDDVALDTEHFPAHVTGGVAA